VNTAGLLRLWVTNDRAEDVALAGMSIVEDLGGIPVASGTRRSLRRNSKRGKVSQGTRLHFSPGKANRIDPDTGEPHEWRDRHL